MTDLADSAASPATPTLPAREPLLKVEGLTKHFPVRSGLWGKGSVVRAVENVNFEVRPGETLGLVGESGCGKTTTGRMLVRLLEPTSGKITFNGEDITHTKGSRLRKLRQDIQIIFQDPYASLNPRHTVGRIVAMPLQVNGIEPPGGVKRRVQELLETVGLNPEHYNRYPHEFSGGQRQRIGIARALALQPKLIVADEPVSALDVSIQAQVVNLLRQLQRDLGLSFVFIAHDLAVVRHFCERIAVMYLGRMVEVGTRQQIYENPAHPYTRALLSAVPDVTKLGGAGRIKLEGDVPSPIDPPSGCVFHTRCWKAQEKCAAEAPVLLPNPNGSVAACHFPETGAVI
ncbi:dipeptide/oligopeptide/nickel ABC transporter ATP-binding protein [Actinoplanes philippinensis]|uniref:Peptide/nickel transport system ATP-binding protein n=1 Tax=Actinoplanes philippinensis TaxID=35752 RepID=A0A1I2FJC0_9ACTN|nr:dipeptide ABC transporter ATP-binding protein [Actinoplanes philippinensis]GIE77828.1 dipeptide/oligopeptide/nickel ABC transporter ATP-binding protein [Actinoplanes philippinensis]SFF05532.1 peptide/nickel transport system ATP-binding protein [Actinoplanes philippinensis]